MLTGPNLPHNWVSDVPAGTSVPLRGRVVQFSQEFIADATTALPELVGCENILELSRRGVLFSTATAGSRRLCWPNLSRRKACAASRCSWS